MVNNTFPYEHYKQVKEVFDLKYCDVFRRSTSTLPIDMGGAWRPEALFRNLQEPKFGVFAFAASADQPDLLVIVFLQKSVARYITVNTMPCTQRAVNGDFNQI